MIFIIISIEWISVSISRRMFQSAFSPIRDTKGDDTIDIVSTPYFPDSPAPAVAFVALETKLCLRLFEDSSNDWTTDSSSSDSSSDWTTDSEAESQESEIPFGWCATP